MKSVGYDIDNVLKPTFALGLRLLNARYGTKYALADFKCSTYEESFNLTREDINELFREASETGLLSKLKPISGSKRIVNKYAKYFNQYFVTARGSSMREETIEWFEKNGFLYVPERFIFDGNSPEKKAKAAKGLGLEMFVEDSLPNANAIAEEAQIPVCLVDFNYPFNKNKKYHQLVRIVCSWKEIDSELKKLL